MEYDTCLSCSSDLRDLSENCACIEGYYELVNSLIYICLSKNRKNNFIKEVKKFNYCLLRNFFYLYFLVECKKKCKSCTTTSSNCLECTGFYRSMIIPNCNCYEGYYEPINSDILSCLSIFFFTFHLFLF